MWGGGGSGGEAGNWYLKATGICDTKDQVGWGDCVGGGGSGGEGGNWYLKAAGICDTKDQVGWGDCVGGVGVRVVTGTSRQPGHVIPRTRWVGETVWGDGGRGG